MSPKTILASSAFIGVLDPLRWEPLERDDDRDEDQLPPLLWTMIPAAT